MQPRSYFNLARMNNQVIKEINESKEIDPLQKESEKNQQYLPSEFYEKNLPSHQTFSSNRIQKHEKTHLQISKQYLSSHQSQGKTITKNLDYNSGKFNSTQAASPYPKLSSESHYMEQIRSQVSDNSVKKKLFYGQSQYSSSPRFIQESKFDNLAYTFKKKVGQYPMLFQENPSEMRSRTIREQPKDQKIQFAKINFSAMNNLSVPKQNNPSGLNINRQQENDLSDIKKQLNFEQISLKQQNPIIKKIRQEIRKDQQEIYEAQTDYKVSRKNQRDLIKKKILESRSDLKRFYQEDSQNVQYQYRKAKFMDIFLGSKTLQHNFR